MRYLYHIAKTKDWNDAKRTGLYKVSSLKRSYEEDGFIHLSYSRQVNIVADLIYKEVNNLLLLKIDPELLTAEIRDEKADLINDTFPHLYGALNTNAVIQVRPYKVSNFGKFPVVSELE